MITLVWKAFETCRGVFRFNGNKVILIVIVTRQNNDATWQITLYTTNNNY